MMARLVHLILVSLALHSEMSEAGPISTDKKICENEIYKCNLNAYKDYRKAVDAGDDGRPDWKARKTCNYVTAAIEDCSAFLYDCYSVDEVETLKNEQFKNILNSLERIGITDWDSNKCPSVKAYLDKLRQTSQPTYKSTPVPVHPVNMSCGNPMGHDGEVRTEECILYTCKKNVWRPSMDRDVCCYQGKAYRSFITNITQDGCTTTMWCKHDGNQASMEYRTTCENIMERIKQTIAKIENRTEYLPVKMDMVEDKIDRVGKHIAATQDKLETIEDTFDQLIKRFGK